MGLGFYLTGCYSSSVGTPDAFLESARAYFEAMDWPHPVAAGVGDDGDGNPALYVHVHPAAEALSVAVPEPGRVVVMAKTSTVGPGFHMHLCEAVDGWARAAGVTIDPPAADGEGEGDEAHYFHARDRDACYAEFHLWLRSLARLVIEHPDGPMSLSMPLECSFDGGEGAGRVLTPMGARTDAWAEATAADPVAGVDLFPWYAAGVNPAARLGYAVHQMWCNVRWARALTDEDSDLQRDVLENLEAAYREDPTLDYPWREWSELIELGEWETELAADVLRLAGGVPAGRPLIGYRRRAVVIRHAGGWSMRIPGEFAVSVDENGWRAFDEERAVHFSAHKVGDARPGVDTAELVLALAPSFDEEGAFGFPTHSSGDVRGRAVLRRYVDPEDDAPRVQLQGVSAIIGRLAICTIDFADERDVDWAVEIWKSITNRNPGADDEG